MAEPNPIAMIGCRDLAALEEIHPELVQLFRQVAAWVAHAGRALHTGAAPGADQAAAAEALAAGGHVHLFLPDARFQVGWRRRLLAVYPERIVETIYDPERHPNWGVSVDLYHPNPKALTPAAERFHARNFGIVSGCGAVIALPKGPEPAEWGGTGQGMRIALATGMPLYNLWEEAAREKLRARVAASG